MSCVLYVHDAEYQNYFFWKMLQLHPRICLESLSQLDETIVSQYYQLRFCQCFHNCCLGLSVLHTKFFKQFCLRNTPFLIRNNIKNIFFFKYEPDNLSGFSAAGPGAPATFPLLCWKIETQSNFPVQTEIFTNKLAGTYPSSRAGTNLRVLQYSPIKYIVELKPCTQAV